MPLVGVNELQPRPALPGWDGRFFHSDNMTFAYWDIAADAQDLHEHHHPQEEVWHVVEGTIAVTVDGTEHTVTPGCAVIVPADTLHSARIVGPCRAIVVDYPLRDQIGAARTGE